MKKLYWAMFGYVPRLKIWEDISHTENNLLKVFVSDLDNIDDISAYLKHDLNKNNLFDAQLNIREKGYHIDSIVLLESVQWYNIILWNKHSKDEWVVQYGIDDFADNLSSLEKKYAHSTDNKLYVLNIWYYQREEVLPIIQWELRTYMLVIDINPIQALKRGEDIFTKKWIDGHVDNVMEINNIDWYGIYLEKISN